MCRYSYAYYAACRHAEFILLEYCSKAHDVPAEDIRTAQDGRSNDEVATGFREAAASDLNTQHIPSVFSTPSPHQHHNQGSSIEEGSVSITAEPDHDCTSISPSHLSHSSFTSTSASHDMAGLPIFGHTFRSWMGGPTVTSPKQTNVESHGHVFMGNRRSIESLQDIGSSSLPHQTLRRHPGIRERTDESSDLPKSNDILQHIAESCRGRTAKHIGIDGRRIGSYGSTIAQQATGSEQAASQDQYDAIEAEIDQLKEDVAILRMEANQGNTEPKTEFDHIVDKFLSTRSKPSIRCKGTKSDETAAMRLQRLHESLQSEDSVLAPFEQDTPSLPSPMDFPALASSSSAAATLSHTREFQRKLSYANVATNGMMEAIDRDCAPPRTQRSNSKVSASTSNGKVSADDSTTRSTISQIHTGSTSVTADTQEYKEDDVSVIIKSVYALDVESPKGSKTTQPSDSKSTIKQSPHFAQPTKSFARRTGETLRRDAASSSPKSPSDSSPGKTTMGKDASFAAAQRVIQQQQKRKSLPGDWLNAAESRAERTAVELTTKSGNVRDQDSPSPSKATRSQLPVAVAKTKISTHQTRDKDAIQQSPPWKKTSSYMAPTNATKQRTMATLAGHKPKIDKPSPKATREPVDIVSPPQQLSSPPRPATALSDNSSVQFILEADVQHLPRQTSEMACKEDHRPLHPQNCPSQRMPKSPPAPTLRAMSPKSPTRGPKAQLQLQSPVRKQLKPANLMAAASQPSLPTVANTTAKRRTSHSNVLTPIFARLDAEGILNRTSQSNGVPQWYRQHDRANGHALRAAQEASPSIANQRPPESSPRRSAALRELLNKKVMPPHLRPKQKESHAASSSSPNGLRIVDDKDHSRLFDTHSHNIANESMSSNVFRPPDDHSQKAGLTTSTTPSLRATAAEFKPSQPFQSQQMTAGRNRSLDWIPSEQWEALPYQTRSDIMQGRAKSFDQAYLSNTIESQLLPIYAAANASAVAALNNMVAQRGLSTGTTSFVDENGSPTTIPTSQMLGPNINVRKKTVQWMLQDVDGNNEPAHFGRAPPPTIPALCEPATPTISSTSDDTSPVKTPNSLQGWHIGSAVSPNPYGWTGGDGKEIKFIGYGPHAERDPNTMINFKYQGRMSSLGNASYSKRFHEDQENLTPEYVAPKSQRQWAEKLGFNKLPCGDVEITRAVEYLPFGSQLAKYCHDCAAR